MRYRVSVAGLTSAALVAAMLFSAHDASAAPKVGKVRPAAKPIAGSYIVVFADGRMSAGTVKSKASALVKKHGGTVQHVYGTAVKGYSARMSAAQAAALAADTSVAYVEQDGTVSIDATQTNPPSYGLDRIDQRNLPLDSSYTYATTASNVTAYIIDTGIRTTHTTFGGRASVGTDTIGDGRNGQDCNGHGTHVAGTVGGSQYGVAKGVKLVAVRVLNCSGSGSNSGVIAGVDWVSSHAIKPAVANMSLGGGVSSALDSSVRNSIASGVTYAIASGNSNTNACNSSPSRVAEALTVNATTSTDARASYSNYGTCTDIFAPGSSITSSWSTSDTATNTISGTSMATPHVAGGAALYLAANPAASPAQVATALTTAATPNVVTNPGSGSPNRLLFTGSPTPPPPPPPPPPGGCSGQILTNAGFESGNTGWTTTAGVVNSGSTNAHAGSWYAWLNGYGRAVTDTLSQTVTIPTGCAATLSYWLRITSSETTTTIAYDKLTVTVNGTTVASYSNLNKSGYALRSVNVSSFAGQTVTVKWTGVEDSSLQTSFFVDDTGLTLS